GGNPHDATTNHNDGAEYNGSVSYVSGEVGQCFSFLDSAALRVPDSQSLHLTNLFAAECWVYPNGQTNAGSVMSKWDSSVNQRSFDLTLNTNGTVVFTVSSNGLSSGASSVLSSAVAPLEQWTHIAATYDGSALKVYINGSLDNSNSYSRGIFAGTNAFALGA